jgi:hypothetical protein
MTKAVRAILAIAAFYAVLGAAVALGVYIAAHVHFG